MATESIKKVGVKYIDKAYGSITTNQNGWVGITAPTVDGTIIGAILLDYNTMSVKSGITVVASGSGICSAANSTITGVSVRFYYI